MEAESWGDKSFFKRGYGQHVSTADARKHIEGSWLLSLNWLLLIYLQARKAL